MFSGDEMTAAISRLPSVVGPASMSSTRFDAAATSSKYLRISAHSASCRSVPMRKPNASSGDLTDPVGACAGSATGSARRSAKRATRRMDG